MTLGLFDVAFVGALAQAPSFDFLNPANIGQPVGGGFFAGLISHTANGVATHALIVAPRATGATGAGYTLTTSLAWALNQDASNGTNYSASSIGAVPSGSFDGLANMAVFDSIGIDNFPGAKFCKDLRIGGFNDWYLPSRLELDIAYFHLKPTTALNGTSSGINDYSVPRRTANYTEVNPLQTSVTAFSTSAEAFIGVFHVSSTEASATTCQGISFSNGSQSNSSKTSASRVRAFRRIAL